MTTENILSSLVTQFKKYEAKKYASEDSRKYEIDYSDFTKWKEIKDLFSLIVSNNQLSKLDYESQVNLLFLIAKGIDYPILLAHIHEGGETLSYIADLSQNDFILLSKTVSKLSDKEFLDAKVQFAKVYRKFKKITKEIEEVLISFYNTDDEYLHRMALLALGNLGYKKIRELVEISWKKKFEHTEHLKMCCLRILHTNCNDVELLKQYLERIPNTEDQYLLDFAEEIRHEIKY